MTRSARVLVADGDLHTLNSVSENLRSRGFVNLLEMTGGQAMNRARHERPDVVILGTQLSDTDPHRLVSDLRVDPVTRYIPILLARGADADDWSDTLADQVDGFLDIPLSGEQLLTRLTAALRLKTMRSELLRRAITMGRFGIYPPDVLDDSSDGAPDVLLCSTDTAALGKVERILAPGLVLEVSREPCAVPQRLCHRTKHALVLAVADDAQWALQLCDDIRRAPTLFHLPVILVALGEHFESAASAYQHGASDVICAPVGPSESRARIEMLIKQERLRSRMLAAYHESGFPEINDPVTGLFVPDFLTKHLELQLEDAFRWDRSLSVTVVHVPEVSRVRETFGVSAAEALLKQLATVISHLVRGEDLCARLDDENFCVVMPESSLEGASAAIQRIAGVISFTEFALSEVTPPVTVRPSLGSAEFKPGDEPGDLVGRAQASAQAAKAA